MSPFLAALAAASSYCRLTGSQVQVQMPRLSLPSSITPHPAAPFYPPTSPRYNHLARATPTPAAQMSADAAADDGGSTAQQPPASSSGREVDALPDEMKALVFVGERQIAYATVPCPRLVQPTDAIVKVLLCAICGRWVRGARTMRTKAQQRTYVPPAAAQYVAAHVAAGGTHACDRPSCNPLQPAGRRAVHEGGGATRARAAWMVATGAFLHPAARMDVCGGAIHPNSGSDAGRACGHF